MKLVLDYKSIRQDIENICGLNRWNTTDKITKTAEYIVRQLKKGGVKNAEVLKVRADGESNWGGWISPLFWTAKHARLSLVMDAKKPQTLVDYKTNPHCLMMYSPGTGNKGVTGDVVAVENPVTERRSLKGKIVLVNEYFLPFYKTTQLLYKKGAAGIICDFHRSQDVMTQWEKEHSCTYHNYSNPPFKSEARLPGFAVPVATGRMLRQKLAAGETVRVHLQVDASLKKGYIPVVTALVPGESDEEIVLTAHMDEPGAADNTSGTVINTELMRAAARQAIKTGKKFKRGLRLYMSTEVRGLQGLFNMNRVSKNVVAGFNLDDVTCEKGQAPPLGILAIHTQDTSLLEKLLAVEAERVDIPVKIKHGISTNDSQFTHAPFHAPMAWLSQRGHHGYHSSLDTADSISYPVLKRMGEVVSGAVTAMLDGVPVQGKAVKPVVMKRGRSVAAREARDIIPIKKFAGLAAFEDATDAQCGKIKEFGAHYIWGVPGWLQLALEYADGTRDLEVIHHMVTAKGYDVPPGNLVGLFGILRQQKKVVF